MFKRVPIIDMTYISIVEYELLLESKKELSIVKKELEELKEKHYNSNNSCYDSYKAPEGYVLVKEEQTEKENKESV